MRRGEHDAIGGGVDRAGQPRLARGGLGPGELDLGVRIGHRAGEHTDLVAATRQRSEVRRQGIAATGGRRERVQRT